MKNSSIDTSLIKKKIAYVGQFKFPLGGADSHRAFGIAQTLHDSGHDVHFCTGQLSQFVPTNALSATHGFDVNYLNFSDKVQTRFSKLIKYLLSGYRTVKWLQRLKTRPDVVLLFGGYSVYAFFVLSWCKRNNVPLIVDVVEWYDPSHLPGGRWGPFRINVELALRYFFVRAGNVIAISRYLERYYQAKGCRALRMPPTLDVLSIPVRFEVTPAGPLLLAYTGVPGKKDLLNNVLEAILRLDSSGQTVLLTIAGPTSNDIIQYPALISRGLTDLPDCVRTLGRVSRNEALDVVRQADYSVLLRPQMRYANAGFPTKVPESLSVGTPVICNLTSDIGDYINNEVNGLICRDHTPEAFSEVLVKALTLSPTQRSDMRRAARSQAENSFDYRQYKGLLSNFLNEARY